MEAVKERVASLEKKLEFIDLNMDDPVEAAAKTPPMHEPQQPLPTEPVLPDPNPVPADDPSSVSAPVVPEVVSQSISETVPESILESMCAEPVSKPSPRPALKCYTRKHHGPKNQFLSLPK